MRQNGVGECCFSRAHHLHPHTQISIVIPSLRGGHCDHAVSESERNLEQDHRRLFANHEKCDEQVFQAEAHWSE
jgi:hypothetical protein